MALTSLSFLAFAFAVVMAGNAFADVRARQWVLAAASAVFLASQVDNVISLLPLGLFLLLAFVALRALQLRPSTPLLVASLGLLVAAFLYLKRYSLVAALPPLPFAYLAVGLSYILFRVVHLLVDARQGGLPGPVGGLAFFNYCCNFLSFVSGPIQRYADSFAARREPPPVLDREATFAAFARIVRGYVKVGVVSAFANYAFEHLSARLFEQAASAAPLPLVGLYLAATASYTIYLYANFAGYMDIVIGIGRLFGCELPENFDRPFAARNFLEFWSRWHITLSDWFKVYVFNPLLALFARRVEAPALQPWLGVAAFFLTFLLMGMWHGSTEVFLVYGLAMGAGASLNKLWQVQLQRRLGKPRYKALAAHPLYAGLARGMTCAWFALALTCFWVDLAQLRQLWQALGASGLLLAYAVFSVASGLWLAAADRAIALGRPLATAAARNLRGEPARNLLLAARVLLIAAVGTLFHQAPEFVYRAF